MIGPRQAQWLNRIGRERDNMRAALRWALDHDPADGEIALRVATALTPFSRAASRSAPRSSMRTSRLPKGSSVRTSLRVNPLPAALR